MPNLDASQVRVAGTGAVWKAPIGTVLPTDSSAAYNAAFVHLGYFTNGFTITQDLKVTSISAWQTLEPVRQINTAIARKLSFEALESDKANIGLAFGGATVTQTGVPAGGAVTFTAGTITTATPHGFAVGTPVFFGTITGTPGVTAGVTYFVLTVPTTTTMTVSATYGGTAVTITTGSTPTVTAAGPYSVSIPDAAVTQEFIIGVDWSDGGWNQRILMPRATFASLPSIKYVRDDAIRFPAELQALKPYDGSNSVQLLGNDWAASA